MLHSAVPDGRKRDRAPNAPHRPGGSASSRPLLFDKRGVLAKLAMQARFERLAQISLVVLAVLAVFFALYAAKSFFLPTTLGIVIAFMGTPVTNRLERWGVPPHAAAGITIVLLVLGVAAGLLVFLPAVQEWGARIPEIAGKLKEELRSLRHLVAAVESASNEVQQSVATGSSSAAQPQPMVVADKGIVSQVASLAPALIAQFAYMLLLAYFLMAERRGVRNLALRIPRTFSTRLRLARIFSLMRHNVSSYLFTIATINLALGILAGLMFFAIGVPSAGLWGAGVALANFVPYVGPIAMQLVVFSVGYVSFGEIVPAIIAPLALAALNFIEGAFVTPAIVGRRARLRPLWIFVAVAFGAWIWGIGGAFVAVPITIVLATLSQGLLIAPARPAGTPPPAPVAQRSEASEAG